MESVQSKISQIENIQLLLETKNKEFEERDRKLNELLDASNQKQYSINSSLIQYCNGELEGVKYLILNENTDKQTDVMHPSIGLIKKQQNAAQTSNSVRLSMEVSRDDFKLNDTIKSCNEKKAYLNDKSVYE